MKLELPKSSQHLADCQVDPPIDTVGVEIDRSDIRIGDLVKYSSRYGVVLHVGKWDGTTSLPDAVWCVWENSMEEALKAYNSLSPEERQTSNGHPTFINGCQIYLLQRSEVTQRFPGPEPLFDSVPKVEYSPDAKWVKTHTDDIHVGDLVGYVSSQGEEDKPDHFCVVLHRGELRGKNTYPDEVWGTWTDSIEKAMSLYEKHKHTDINDINHFDRGFMDDDLYKQGIDLRPTTTMETPKPLLKIIDGAIRYNWTPQETMNLHPEQLEFLIKLPKAPRLDEGGIVGHRPDLIIVDQAQHIPEDIILNIDSRIRLPKNATIIEAGTRDMPNPFWVPEIDLKKAYPDKFVIESPKDSPVSTVRRYFSDDDLPEEGDKVFVDLERLRIETYTWHGDYDDIDEDYQYEVGDIIYSGSTGVRIRAPAKGISHGVHPASLYTISHGLDIGWTPETVKGVPSPLYSIGYKVGDPTRCRNYFSDENLPKSGDMVYVDKTDCNVERLLPNTLYKVKETDEDNDVVIIDHLDDDTTWFVMPKHTYINDKQLYPYQDTDSIITEYPKDPERVPFVIEPGAKVRIKHFDERPDHWNDTGKMDHWMGKTVTIREISTPSVYITETSDLDYREWRWDKSDFEPL